MKYVRIEHQQEQGPSVQESWYDPGGKLSAIAYTNPDGSGYRTEYNYDENGDLVDPSGDRKVIRNADGSRREIEQIPVRMNLSWGRIDALDKAGGLAFSTRMASQVEVSYDPLGLPVEAVFSQGSGEITSRIEFRSDAAGNVIGILQYGGSQPSFPLAPNQEFTEEDRQKFVGFFTPGGLEIRVELKYDEAGHPLERAIYFGNELTQRTVWTYNEHGDIATSTEKDGWPSRFEYQYGERGNWTRKVVGSDETLRKFEYYD